MRACDWTKSHPQAVFAARLQEVPVLKGNVLGLYLSIQTAHISLILDFPREEDAEQDRERIGSSISTLLA